MKIKVAITGGIGSGKSSVLAILKGLGYPVYSCDEIYKNLLQNEEYIETIRVRFGCVKDGKIQTEQLSRLVFSNPKKREELNAVAHPLIMKELRSSMDAAPFDVVFAEVPLLFEGGYETLFDKILVVHRDKSLRVSSVERRDALTKDEILARINSQIDYDSSAVKEKMENFNAYRIDNDGDIHLLENKIKKFIKIIQP